MAGLREKNIYAYIGYLPLHSAPKGLEYGYHKNDLPLTEDLGNRIVRLPFYTELGEVGLDYCIIEMKKQLNKIYNQIC